MHVVLIKVICWQKIVYSSVVYACNDCVFRKSVLGCVFDPSADPIAAALRMNKVAKIRRAYIRLSYLLCYYIFPSTVKPLLIWKFTQLRN